jgi:mono/diheme cytochrome c family protein
MIKARRIDRRLTALAAAGIVCSVSTITPAKADDGWFTQAQATTGHQQFNNYCAQCHRPDLTGADGPALVGQSFLQHWSGKPLSELYDFEHQNMPATNPGSLSAEQIWSITAYILQKNGFSAGSSDVATSAPKTLVAPSSASKK